MATISGLSYLCYANSFLGKTISLYWIWALSNDRISIKCIFTHKYPPISTIYFEKNNVGNQLSLNSGADISDRYICVHNSLVSHWNSPNNFTIYNINGFLQDRGNSSAFAMQLSQWSCHSLTLKYWLEPLQQPIHLRPQSIPVMWEGMTLIQLPY